MVESIQRLHFEGWDEIRFEKNPESRKCVAGEEAQLVLTFDNATLVIGGAPHVINTLIAALNGTAAYISLVIKRDNR